MSPRTEKRRNRRALRVVLAAGVAAAWFTITAPPPALALAVVCVNCSTIGQQLISYAKQIAQWETELNQLQQQIQLVDNAITNTANLPDQIFQDATSNIQHLTSIANGASLIAGNTETFISNLRASSYPLPGNPMQEIVQEQNAISNALQSVGRVLNLQEPQLTNNAAILASLQSQSMSATGRMQALQLSNELAATTGQQLQSLQTTILAMAQTQGAVALSEADRRAMEDAAMDQFSTYTPYPTTGWKGF